MKVYPKKVVISAAALFLLMALVAPAISASDTISNTGSGYAAPVTQVNEEPELIEPVSEPEPERPLPEAEESEQSAGTGEMPADIPQEEKDPLCQEITYLEEPRGKSNAHGKGFLRNLLRDIK